MASLAVVVEEEEEVEAPIEVLGVTEVEVEIVETTRT